MEGKKRAGLLAASAAVVLFAGFAAEAQMMVPLVRPPPDRIEFYSDSPKVEPGDLPGNWSARENVIESDRYEWLVHSDPAFRAARIQKECGMFTDPANFQQCAASFDR